MAGVAEAVVDTLGAWHRAEKREVVGGDVDRSAPRPLDLRIGEAGQQTAQTVLRARRRGAVAREAVVELAAEADRAGAAAHQHPAVRSRAEVVQEHAAVDDRLSARPPDLGEQLWHRFREPDVRAEVRQVARDGTPTCGGRVDREHYLRGTHAAPRCRHLAVAVGRRTVFMQLNPRGEHAAAQRTHEPGGLDGGAVGEEHAATEDRRPDARGELVAVQRSGLLWDTGLSSGGDRVLHCGVLRGCGRDHHHPAFAKPPVILQRAHGRHDALARAGELEGVLAPEQRHELR
jgi:hypothetical protein